MVVVVVVVSPHVTLASLVKRKDFSFSPSILQSWGKVEKEKNELARAQGADNAEFSLIAEAS